MNYFAQIVNNIVIEVTCVNSDIADGAQFCHDLLGGDWVQTYIDDPNKTYAGINSTYDPATDNFIAPPQPETE